MRTLAAICLAVTASAQSGLNRPTLGTMLDSGQAKPISGVAAAVTLGDPVATGVLSLACSSQFCLFKTAEAILANGQVTESPRGPAVFAIDSSNAFVFFAESRQFARWQNGQLAFLPMTLDGEILSLGIAADGGLLIAVRRNNATWIVNPSNEVLGSIASAGPVMLLQNGSILSLVQDSLLLTRADGSQLTFAAAGASQLVRISDDYIQIRAGRTNYALRITPAREQLFRLPDSTSAAGVAQ